MQAFVADYGPQVLNAPPTSGFALGAWALPGLVLALGLVLATLLVRRGRLRAAPEAAPVVAVDEAAAPPDAYRETFAAMARDEARDG